MIRKIVTTGLLAGFLAIGLAGCDLCCGDSAATTESGGAALQAGDSGDCAKCLEGFEECPVAGSQTPAADAAGVAGDMAAPAVCPMSGMQGDHAACQGECGMGECTLDQECRDEPCVEQVEDCGKCEGGQCDAPPLPPSVED